MADITAGCGDKTQAPDPFLGTWQQINTLSPTTPLVVISKGDATYRATYLYPAAHRQVTVIFTRRGMVLSSADSASAHGSGVVLTYAPASEHLFSQQHGQANLRPVEMSRLDQNTLIASPPPPPLVAMRVIARRQHAAKAWYAELPLRDAFKLVAWESAVPGEYATTPTYVLVMKGNFGIDSSGTNRPLRWAAALMLPNPGDRGVSASAWSFAAQGLTLTPLQFTRQ